jgi:D-tyrosyl-tRNA(Tyr) deacylase
VFNADLVKVSNAFSPQEYIYILKVLLQRVNKASVNVGDKIVGNIGKGIVALVGIACGDTENDVKYLAQKTLNLRIFEDDRGKFNLSILDTRGEILVVSQFTLLADTVKGRRPSFVQAASPEIADLLIEKYVTKLRESGLNVATGRFRQHMLVEIHNDGPVTIMLDSRKDSN